MSRPSTRRSAVEQVGPLATQPGAAGFGLRDWLDMLGACDGHAAAFDTRVSGNTFLTGRAAQGVGAELRAHGFGLLAAPESFLVNRHNVLIAGELKRARAWGVSLVALMPVTEPHAPADPAVR